MRSFARVSAMGVVVLAMAGGLLIAQQAPPRGPTDAAPSGQRDPVHIAGEKYKVKLDNERVRVLEVTLESGGTVPMHAHPEYVVYALGAGKVRFTAPDGSSSEMEMKEGECVSRPAEAHSVENIGGSEMRVLNIEFKHGREGRMARHDDQGAAAVPAAHQGREHEHLVVTPQQLEWKDGPPGLPPGAKFMVMEGDPSQPGAFALRAKLPANYTIPPHWHPSDERVTVISGTLYMGAGETVDKSAAKALPAGSYTVMPAQMRHFAYAQEPVELQLHGIGPWDIIYLNPGDDPRKK